jgi:hypothetical protein
MSYRGLEELAAAVLVASAFPLRIHGSASSTMPPSTDRANVLIVAAVIAVLLSMVLGAMWLALAG